MDTVFTAHTSHGTVLAVDVADRRVRHVPPGELSLDRIPLCVLTGDALGQRCVPFGVNPETGSPVLPREISPGSGLLLYAGRGDEAGTLRSAVTQHFLSAIPGGALEINRTAAATWEQFSLVPGPPLESGSAPALEQFLALAKSALATSVPLRDAIPALLSSPPSEGSAALVEAIWPLLTVAEFDALAGQLRHDKALCGQIMGLFSNDDYAVTVLPALVAWLAAHDAPATPPPGNSPIARPGAWSTPWHWRNPEAVSDAAAMPARPPLRTIGPELDHLARDGYDGQLASFPHACNASLRAAAAPSKGTAIVATARSEGVYLLEWIAHYRLLGIEAIFLYTNNNDDGSDALLAALHAAGVITWTRSELAAGVSAQNKAYGHALNVNLPLLDYRWALFIDLDEFLVLNPARYHGIAEFARWHELRETDAVGINWVMVGSSGQARWSEAPLTRRNIHLLNEPNAHIKVMLAPCKFIQAHPHFPFADRRRAITFRLASGAMHEHRKQAPGKYHARAFSDDPSSADACLYHYNFKSVEEFAWKSSRNRGDFPMSHDINFVSLDQSSVELFMVQHRSTDVTQNDRLSQCAPGLEQEMARLRTLPGVAEAERAVVTQFRHRLSLLKARLLNDPRMAQLGRAAEELRALLQTTIP